MKTDLVSTGYIFNEDKLLLIRHAKLNMWLPVGGHIEKDETPDQTVLREIKEETNLDIEILFKDEISEGEGIKKVLATPFHVNVHSVGDHDHCSFSYICNAKNPESIKINKEIKDFKWVSESELDSFDTFKGIKDVAKKAFRLKRELDQ